MIQWLLETKVASLINDEAGREQVPSETAHPWLVVKPRAGGGRSRPRNLSLPPPFPSPLLPAIVGVVSTDVGGCFSGTDCFHLIFFCERAQSKSDWNWASLKVFGC